MLDKTECPFDKPPMQSKMEKFELDTEDPGIKRNGSFSPKRLEEEWDISEQSASLKSVEKKQYFSGLKEYFGEYCKNSSLHGIKYIGEKRRNIWEKLWWCALFSIALTICSFLIMKTYWKWQTTPVIVSFAQAPTMISEIPFPAVTICPETKVAQTRYNYTEFFHKFKNKSLSPKEVETFSKMSLVCNQDLVKVNGNRTENEDILNFLVDLAPNFSNTFEECYWNNIILDCNKIFTPTLNEEGICYTFNMFSGKKMYTDDVFIYANNKTFENVTQDWFIEEGYKKKSKIDTFPKRTMSAGARTGLRLILLTYIADLDYICKSPVQGFKLILHQPAELSRGSMQYYRVPLNQEVVVAIQPNMMTTSAGLRNYMPDQRNCFFQVERKLRYFRNYTQQNCQIECLTNATLDLCKCVAFHMPRTKDTLICGSGSISCMQSVEAGILSNFFNEDFPNITKDYKKDCNCLPACYSLGYNAEISQANFEWKKLFKALERSFPGENLSDLAEMVHYASTTIFFKEMQFISTQRNELYGSTDFLANCGGIFGLFTGFSLLSCLEIIYYLTLRLAVNKWKFGKYFMATPIGNSKSPGNMC